MPDSDVVSFDAAAAVEGISAALDDEDDLHVVAAFTPGTYDLVHVGDLTRSVYADDEEMRAHFDRIHAYAGIDFSEIGLFVDDLFPVAEGVEYLVTGLDYLTVVRIYAGREALFVSVDTDVRPATVVDAVREAVAVDLGAAGDSIGVSGP